MQAKKIQKDSKRFKRLEPSGTFWNLLEPSRTSEFQIDDGQTDGHTLALLELLLRS